MTTTRWSLVRAAGQPPLRKSFAICEKRGERMIREISPFRCWHLTNVPTRLADVHFVPKAHISSGYLDQLVRDRERPKAKLARIRRGRRGVLVGSLREH